MKEWVKAASNGDPRAWSRLYRENFPWLYAHALRILGNSRTVRDLVQECFIQAFLKLPQLKDPNSFPAWIKMILTRQCWRHNSHYANRHLDEFAMFSEHIIDLSYTQLKETNPALYSCMATLSETLQSVIMLKYFSSRNSYEEMAAILSVPVGTIRSRLNQAKLKMRENWENNETDAHEEEAFEWNEYYNNYFGSLHNSQPSRATFISHLEKNLHLIFTSGKAAYGRKLIEKEISDDLEFGNYFSNVQVASSANLSVVEVSNINSSLYPDRCPPSGIFVLYRNKDKVHRMHFHNSR